MCYTNKDIQHFLLMHFNGLSVKEFQQEYNLEPDGIVGPKTKAKVAECMRSLHSNLNKVLGTNLPTAGEPFYTKATEEAVKQFANSVPAPYADWASGIAHAQLRAELNKQAAGKGGDRSAVRKTLKVGSPEEELVIYLQEILISQKLYSGDADGIFGKNTEKAVKEFQQRYSLLADGIVGDNTWAKLLEYAPG